MDNKLTVTPVPAKDEIVLSVKTTFLRTLLSKFIERTIHNKFGYSSSMRLSDLDIRTSGGNVRMHLDIDAEMTEDQFRKLMKDILGKEA